MNFSFFNFMNRQKTDRVQAPRQEGAPEIAQSSVSVEPEKRKTPLEQEAPGKMVLDLRHLTPETLEAFFPSERNLAG